MSFFDANAHLCYDERPHHKERNIHYDHIQDPDIKKLLHNKTFYQEAIIPSDVYKGINSEVPSFGIGPVLVTRKDVSGIKVEMIIEAMFSN